MFASAVIQKKMYVIGGADGTSETSKKVEVFDADTNQWSNGSPLQYENRLARSITVDGKIYLFGGKNSSNQNINQVLCFDPSTDQWLSKASMPTARDGMWLQWYGSRIWAIGGYSGEQTNVVESYDPVNDSWQTETSLSTKRNWAVGWVANSKIYVGGGDRDGGNGVNTVVVYNPTTKQWSNSGNLPENKYLADAVVLNDKVYVIAGYNGSSYSNKVYAADLNASVAGVYDLYRKDGNASTGTPLVQAEVADGSVTASKIANKTIGKGQISDDILKYLKPEITAQPQPQTVYADSNASLSVTADGKYLNYRWKKDGSNLADETNSTLNITDANATLHDGNYSVVVSNDFGSVESGEVEVKISDALMNGLVAWWKFDETNGTVAYDSSGNGNDGNLTNSPTWVNGKIGGALSFDGVDDSVKIDSLLDHMTQMSLSAWVKGNSLPNSYNEILVKEKVSVISITNGGKFLTNSGDGNDWYLQSNDFSNGFLALNQWYFVLTTHSSQTANLYIDGLLDKTLNLNSAKGSNSNFTSIGAKFIGNVSSGHFDGLIDDVRIYDRALSVAEVQALYNLGQ